MRWVPVFHYGATFELTLALTLGVGIWDDAVSSGGGMRETADGVPGAWLTWRKQLLTVPLRFFESEWPGVRALIEWGQTKAPFIWVPESNTDLMTYGLITSALVTLESPSVHDTIAPIIDPNYARVLSLPLVFRQINSVES